MNKIDRERFFVQYWNQKVLYVGGVGLVNLGKGGWNLSHPDFKLYLRSIDSLTDEELINICKVGEPLCFMGNCTSDKWKVSKSKQNFASVYSKHNDYSFEIDLQCLSVDRYYQETTQTGVNNQAIIDHARSIGILVPFAQYSVEQILEMGWAKLITESKNKE